MSRRRVDTTVSEIFRGNLWGIREANALQARKIETLSGAHQDESEARFEQSTWSQAEVAGLLGIPESTYRGWERDPKSAVQRSKSIKRSFTVTQLIHCANALGCDITALLMPTATDLEVDVIFRIEDVQGRSQHAIEVPASIYALWIQGMHHLPGQNPLIFDQTTRRSHDHGPTADTRTKRTFPPVKDFEDKSDKPPDISWRGTLAEAAEEVGGDLTTHQSALPAADRVRVAISLARRSLRIQARAQEMTETNPIEAAEYFEESGYLLEAAIEQLADLSLD